MALGQTRGSVGTDGGRNHVLVVVGIHDTSHPRHQTALPVAVVVEVGLSGGLVECIVLEIVGGDDLCAASGRLISGLLGRIHAHHIEIVLLGESAVEGDKVLNGPVAGLVFRNPAAVGGVGILVVDTCAGESTALGGTEVQTDIDAVAQAFHPRALHLAEERVVGTDTLVLAEPSVLVSLHGLFGDYHLVVGRKRVVTFQVSVLVVRTCQRRCTENGVHIVDTLCHAVAGVGAETEVEPLAHHLVEVASHRHTVIPLCGKDRLIAIITCSEAVAAPVGTSGYTHVVAVADTRLVVEVLPVGVDIITLIEGVLIHAGILAEFGEGRSVHHGILVEDRLEVDISVVGNLCGCALYTLHGGDDDHTIGTAATVDSGGGGILEDIHRLDVGGVDIRELSHERNTVEHDERVVGSAERALSTDTNLHFGARFRRSLRHEHTCHTALESLRRVGGGNLIQFLTVHIDHRTRDGLTALSTITDDDHLVEVAALRLEYDVKIRLVAHSHLLCDIAHIRDDQCGTRFHVDGEVTVEIGHDTIGGAFLQNGGADEGALSIADTSCHFLCLLHLVHRIGVGRSCHSLCGARKSEYRAEPH